MNLFIVCDVYSDIIQESLLYKITLYGSLLIFVGSFCEVGGCTFLCMWKIREISMSYLRVNTVGEEQHEKDGNPIHKIRANNGSTCPKPEVTMRAQVPLGPMTTLERALVIHSPGNGAQINPF